MKKLFCVLLTLAMLFSLIPAGFADDIEIVDTEPGEQAELEAQTETLPLPAAEILDANVPIDEEHFPNEHFRDYVADYFDADKNGYLDEEEIAAATDIHISSVDSLKGLEYFPNLAHLECTEADLTELDVSQNPKLKTLICQDNQITELDLSNNPELEELNCGINQLTELDISHNLKLKTLTGYFNQLTELDVTQHAELEVLNFFSNQLKELDVSHNAKLTELNFMSNQLKEIDVSHNPMLERLYCNSNQLTELDLSANPLLRILNCQYNQLTKLDLAPTPLLIRLSCQHNAITELDVRPCPGINSAAALGSEDFFDESSNEYEYENCVLIVDSMTKLLKASFVLDADELMIPVKDTVKPTPTHLDGNVMAGNELRWTSSDETVATVDERGRITARKYGKCRITAVLSETYTSVDSRSIEVQTLFWDVADPGVYYFKHVYWAAENGITKGYDLEYFAPQEECTREQMMTFLWRLAGQPEPTTTSSRFPDVKKGAYYYKAVLWGVEKGITNGYSSGPYAGKFGVSVSCTREQAMTFLWRMANKPEPQTTTNKFKDVKSSDYFYKAVLWASENGIANGYSDGTYGVGLACLREHMVTFLSRYASKFM